MTVPPPERYPRDMIGYGATTPDPKWPGGARIAVQFVVNYEEGGENNVLHGDPASEAFLSEIVGAQPWPGQRHWNMESIYEYGSRAGFWRLRRLFNETGIKPTVYGVTTALARSPEQVKAMQADGWEIASHGLRWIEHKDMSQAEERAEMQAAVRLHKEVTGETPRGWYTGRCSMNTVRLASELGMDYVSDAYDDDLPYWRQFALPDRTIRDQLIIPYTLDANDMRFATPQGFNTGAHFESYLRDTFDALYAEGDAGAPKMMSVGLHCRLAGRPGRVQGLRRFIEYCLRHDGVWMPRRIEIAEHWARQHPPGATTVGRDLSRAPSDARVGVERDLSRRPSEMERDAFVAAFGGIFEHSAWVADAAYDLELGPAHDTAAGLHHALCRVFRSASDTERLGVLKAHPDLAGKLAAAKRLTADSTSEQASAGLDALTDDERAAFTRLNTAYTAKHGFPFIITVRDHSKAEILAAFEKRLEYDTGTEFLEACRHVERIAELRLEALF